MEESKYEHCLSRHQDHSQNTPNAWLYVIVWTQVKTSEQAVTHSFIQSIHFYGGFLCVSGTIFRFCEDMCEKIDKMCLVAFTVQWQYSSLRLVLPATSNVACVFSVTAETERGIWETWEETRYLLSANSGIADCVFTTLRLREPMERKEKPGRSKLGRKCVGRQQVLRAAIHLGVGERSGNRKQHRWSTTEIWSLSNRTASRYSSFPTTGILGTKKDTEEVKWGLPLESCYLSTVQIMSWHRSYAHSSEGTDAMVTWRGPKPYSIY